MKRLRVRDKVMTTHDACTSRTSRVLIVASLQRLKMEALIPAPADCEVPSVIKFFNPQSIAPIEIYQLLPGLWTHTARRSTHLMQEFGWEVFNHHPIAQTSCPVIIIFSYISRNSCLVRVSIFQNDRGGDEYHSDSNPRQ